MSRPSSKRHRAESEPARPTTITENYNPDFVKTADCDVVFESAEKTHFATQQLFLRACSSVSRDTLLVGSEPTTDKDKVDGLPIINLTERSDLVQRFLALSQTSPVLAPAPVSDLDTLDDLLTMCDKYNAPLVGQLAVYRFFPSLEVRYPMSHIAVALIHSQYQTRPYLEEGIRQMRSRYYPNPAADFPLPGILADGTKMTETRTGERLISLSDLQRRHLHRMAAEDLVEISRIQMRVVQESSYDYKQAAADFQVRLPPRRCPCPRRSPPRPSSSHVLTRVSSRRQVKGYPKTP